MAAILLLRFKVSELWTAVLQFLLDFELVGNTTSQGLQLAQQRISIL